LYIGESKFCMKAEKRGKAIGIRFLCSWENRNSAQEQQGGISVNRNWKKCSILMLAVIAAVSGAPGISKSAGGKQLVLAAGQSGAGGNEAGAAGQPAADSGAGQNGAMAAGQEGTGGTGAASGQARMGENEAGPSGQAGVGENGAGADADSMAQPDAASDAGQPETGADAGQPEDTDADGNIHADIKKENPDISAEITPAGSGSDDVVIQENDKPYLALGANLKEDQKLTVLSLMGIDPANLSQYNVVTVTNEEEHQYLDDYLDASTIGTRALSSVVIVKREKGDGIHIATKNITYCTVGMYKNALATAGLEDADVIVAGPFPLSGTAALIGAMKAYADMENADVDTESLDAAMNEIVVTGELNESLGEDVQTEEFIAYVKQKVVEGGLQDKAKIQEVISKACSKFEIVLDDSEKEQITALMEKIGSLDIDVDSLLQQAGSIYDSLKEMEENTGFFGSIAAFFKNLLAAIIEFFQGLFGS